LYYGDEIGMGDNIYLGDRFGVRTPMQWNMNINAGFSSANPQKLFLPIITDPMYRHESINVATQEENPSSLLWWIRNLLSMRKRLGVFGKGNLKFIESSNSKVLCFARSYEKENIIVVANLSQFSQATTLDLKSFKDCDITEVFSQNRFMSVGEGEYSITVGPYGYFWFQADQSEKKEQSNNSNELFLFKSELSWERTFSNYNDVRVLERKVLATLYEKVSLVWRKGKSYLQNQCKQNDST
jgi:maltose alpha-D-glucosyltransferase/alpha-amylase